MFLNADGRLTETGADITFARQATSTSRYIHIQQYRYTLLRRYRILLRSYALLLKSRRVRDRVAKFNEALFIV